MSVKANSLVAAAAMALGVTVAMGASPICEALLNDVTIVKFGAAEVDPNGRVIVIVTVRDSMGVDTVRPVADSLGNVRLFAGADAAVSLAKRANTAPGSAVTVVKLERTYTVGDPLIALRAKFRRYKSEGINAAKQLAAVNFKITGAVALGWDMAVNTPERFEYDDLIARRGSVTEWKTLTDATVTSLAASLTAAGIDPLTIV